MPRCQASSEVTAHGEAQVAVVTAPDPGFTLVMASPDEEE